MKARRQSPKGTIAAAADSPVSFKSRESRGHAAVSLISSDNPERSRQLGGAGWIRKCPGKSNIIPAALQPRGRRYVLSVERPAGRSSADGRRSEGSLLID